MQESCQFMVYWKWRHRDHSSDPQAKKRRGRPLKHGNPQAQLSAEMPLSLPPAAPEPVTMPPPTPVLALLPRPGPQDPLFVPEDSKVRVTALKIIAMRSAGVSEEEIATAVGLSKSTISSYVYRAGRNGWLDLQDPKDRLEYQLLHKVVRNLEEGLEADAAMTMNTGMPVRTAVALKIADGTVFKKFGQEGGQVSQQTTVAVQIVMPDGPAPVIREGTTGGAMAFLEGEMSPSAKD